MYVLYNPNPQGDNVGDCVIRAISKITGNTWERTYIELAIQGFMMCDMPSANHVWGAYLHSKGFNRSAIPTTFPDCYTVKDFVKDNPHGKYILAMGTHVIAIVNGNYFDTWDSGNEIPIYYWHKED